MPTSTLPTKNEVPSPPELDRWRDEHSITRMEKLLVALGVALLLGGCGDEHEHSDRKGNEPKESKRVGEPTKAGIVAEKFSDEEIEKMAAEANTLLEEGKYARAQAKMTEAYGAFNNRADEDEAMLVFFLKSFCKISDALQENDKAIQVRRRGAGSCPVRRGQNLRLRQARLSQQPKRRIRQSHSKPRKGFGAWSGGPRFRA